MLLNTVIIILREVLEAALLISVLMAISHLLSLGLRWLVASLTTGLIGAFLYQYNLEAISASFDYVGQEVTNASLQIAIYACLAITVFTVNLKPSARQLTIISASMASAVSLAIIREGSEIIIYLSGFLHQQAYLWSVFTGSIIGGSIGISFGALMYYILRNGSRNFLLISSLSLLALVAASMLSQAVQLLIQADWIASRQPLWDSSNLLSETSITGQLLYAIVGYESTPTLTQACAYLFALASLLLLFLYRKLSTRKLHHE